MKRKVIGIVVCMLFLLSSLSISISATSFIKDEKLEDKEEIFPCSFDEKFTVRVEIEKIYKGIWKVNAYAKNKFDESFHVEWPNGKTFTIGYFYKVPDEDLNLFVYDDHRGPLWKIINPLENEFNFGPFEEKLLQSGYFFGYSNLIRLGFRNGYTEYISSFPKLSEGDYEIHALLNAYRIGTIWKGTYEFDKISFYYDR